MTTIDKAILDHLAVGPNSGRADIKEAVGPGPSRATLARALQRLVAEGRVEAVGKGRATRYRLAGAAAVRSHLATPHNQRRLVATTSRSSTVMSRASPFI